MRKRTRISHIVVSNTEERLLLSAVSNSVVAMIGQEDDEETAVTKSTPLLDEEANQEMEKDIEGACVREVLFRSLDRSMS